MRWLVSILIALTLSLPAFAENMVLLNGIIIDGTAKPRVLGNIRIRDGKITDIGEFKPLPGETTIDIKGLTVAPGFIDIHNHSLAGLQSKPDALSQIMQGITTVALGPDGAGPINVESLMKGFDENPAALNVLTFVGEGSIRRQIMGDDYKRAATPEEISKMAELVNRAMSEGAFGLSSGLEHDSGLYATNDELIALAKVVTRFGGIYMTQMRNEGDDILTSIRDSISVGRAAKIPVEISHLRLMTSSVWGKTVQVLAEFDKAHAEGLDITADVYPYDSYPMDIVKLVPSGKLYDVDEIEKGIADIGGANNVIFVQENKHPEYAFQSLADVARSRNMAPPALFVEVIKDGGADIMCTSLSDRDIRAFLKSRWVMVASDGGLDVSHPRSAGAFPRVISQFVEATNTLPLELAIAKMTSVPATRLGIKDRGVLRKGAFADIVVFDATHLHDNSTFQDPFALAEGVKDLFVNGVMVVKDGQPTNQKPGMALR